MHDKFTKLYSFACRLILGVGGQIGVSGANFLLSLLLITQATTVEFGTFAFIQILIFFGFGISNALLSAPLMAEIHRHDKPLEETLTSYFSANAILSLLASVVIGLMAYGLFHQSPINSLLFFSSAFFLLLARLGRSYLLDHDYAKRVLVSDYIYSILLVAGCFYLYFFHHVSIYTTLIVLTISSFLSYCSMGVRVITLQVAGLTQGKMTPFIEGVRLHGRYAIVGVVTSEFLSRAHSYIVSLWLGPAAFAPLAAAGLFFRPVSLVVLSLTQFELAGLARVLKTGDTVKAWMKLKFFYLSLFITWIANIILIVIVMEYFFDDLLADKYSYHDMVIALSLFALITAFVCFRSPAGALLQANANFKPLAKITVIACAITLPIVFFCVYQFGAVWSLLGVLLGECISAILVYRLARYKVPTR